MIGALWTGISGLAAHQTALDNESNNIANVNTVGYKAGRISFADQIYQGKIGKGSFVQDAEKIFVTGGSKITGVEYDVALQGDGFFTVRNKNTLGTAETFYTRAGNFRMGESGTLQNPDGYEVQGWTMSSIDQKNDVKSTNHNASKFTDAYVKNLGNSIIRDSDQIETIAAKATNFDETAKSDSTTVFSGDGAKTKASKLKDIDLAMADYNKWLQKYKDDPTLPSAGSTAQVSQMNFKTGLPPTSIIGKEGDSVYAVINGNTYSQEYVLTKSNEEDRRQLWKQTSGAEQTLHSLVDPASIPLQSAINAMAVGPARDALQSQRDTQIGAYDRAFSKIETYKHLADKISNKEPGLVATLAKGNGFQDAAAVPPVNIPAGSDTLDPRVSYEDTTNLGEMLKGIIQVKSLIPGKEFKITEVGETSNGSNTQTKGVFQSTAIAVEGSGEAAIESARDALSKLITGKQQDVYTHEDLLGVQNFEPSPPNPPLTPTADPARAYQYTINIYDKDRDAIIPVPNDGANPPQALTPPFIINTPGGTDRQVIIDKLVEDINNHPQLSEHIVAKNVNGYFVVQTLDRNYDVEFNGSLTWDDAGNQKLIEVNPNYSGRKGAGAEFMEITTRVDQTSTQNSLQLRLDVLNISDSKFGQFSIDDTGLVTIKEGGVEYAVGQVSIARFTNNRGLEAVGNNNFQRTQESGNAIYSINNNNTAGVKGQALELSKADLSESLVNLMVFQRAFEANAKSITTSDELLSTLINLKR